MDFAADAQCMSASRHGQTRSDIPLVVRAPGEQITSNRGEQSSEIAYLNPGHGFQIGRWRRDHLRHADVRGLQVEIGPARKIAGEAAVGRANVQQCGRRDHVSPGDDVILIGALRTHVAAARRRPEAGRVSIFLAMLESECEIKLVLLVENVVLSAHWLVIPIFADVPAVDEVLVQLRTQT